MGHTGNTTIPILDSMPYKNNLHKPDELRNATITIISIMFSELCSASVFGLDIHNLLIFQRAHVMGIKCEQIPGDPGGASQGALASLSSGLITDSSWQCSDTVAGGWASAGFTGWDSAQEVAPAGDDVSGGVSSEAFWILPDSPGNPSTFYCRREMSEFTGIGVGDGAWKH